METNLMKMLIPVSLFMPVKKVGYQNIGVHIFKIHTKNKTNIYYITFTFGIVLIIYFKLYTNINFTIFSFL